MKYYIIAGEASGDLHGSNLMYALQAKDKEADFRVWGGNLMEKAGGTLVEHYKNTAFMGFVEVVKNLNTILQFIKKCKEDILQYQADVLILIDYPGFNLRIADFAHKEKIKTFYYISPQLWAWKENRVHKIKRTVDRMFVILPFEKAFYQKWEYEVDFVGHPLLDAIAQEGDFDAQQFKQAQQLDERSIIALLPGSRQQEIKKGLPEMLKLVSHFPQYQFVIAAAPNIAASFLKNIIGNNDVKIVYNQTYNLLKCARTALVTSGTATLETALLGVPQVVCYKGNWLSYQIGKRLVKVDYISLVNLILDKPLLTELIQDDFEVGKLKSELTGLLEEGKKRQKILEGYAHLKEKLGNKGASKRAADLMLQYLS